jgi:hypothetical protein
MVGGRDYSMSIRLRILRSGLVLQIRAILRFYVLFVNTRLKILSISTFNLPLRVR